MKKISTIALAVTMALSSTSVLADAGNHANGIEHLSTHELTTVQPKQLSLQSVSAKKMMKMSRSSASVSSTGITPNDCTTAEFAQYSGNDLVEYVSNAHNVGNADDVGYDCFRIFFEDASNASTIFSSNNVDAVATALIADISNGVSEREMFGKVMYLRGMYYGYAMLKSGVMIADETKVKQALDLVNSTYNGSSSDLVVNKLLANNNHALTSYYLAENIVSGDTSRLVEFVTLVDRWVDVLNNIKPHHTDEYGDSYQYSLYDLSNSIMQSVDLVISFTKNESQNIFTHSTLPAILAEYSWNVAVDAPVDTNALANLIFLFQGNSVSDEVISSVQSVIDNTTKFSTQHVTLLGGISNYSVDCTIFGRDSSLCSSDELVAEMRDFALPNTWTFGDITFVTQMTKERSYHIYNSLQATRSQFFRDTGITEAVDDDPNAQSTFVIYGSPNDYKAFHNFLYGLSSDNGGIYIEQDGTLYTFDRPDTEMFVLEELARHEYAHYLISRYLVNGMWGETTTYDNDRMVWVDEGLANYFTSATQHDGTAPLATMIEMKGWSDQTRSISEITNTNYGDSWMYPYSALLFNYLESIGSDTLVDMSAALVADDLTEFDSIVSGLTTHNDGFQTYANGLTTDGWEAPWWTYKTGAQLEESGVDSIQTSLTTAFGSASCTENADEFSCTFSLEETQVDVINSTLNAGIVEALQSGPNNIETMTCHPASVGSTAECIGLLRPDDVPFDDGTDEPVDSDGDGYPDEDDAFPNDPTEWLDTDGDGVGDNADAFPNDATETTDTDGDGVGDNADAFPNDATETTDTDGDGYGDNSDVFPNDATEWADSDGDTYGDNSDAFPNDSSEWLDTDGDGHGDNSDYYPNDASKWEQDTTTTTPSNPTPTADKSSSGGSFGILSGLLLMLTLFTRRFNVKK